MAWTLTTPVNLPNQATRLVLPDRGVDEDEENNTVRVRMELRTSVASGNRTISTKVVTVRNGESDLLEVRPSGEFVAGMVLEDILKLTSAAVSTPSGYTNVMAAWRSGTLAARKDAVLAALAAAGVLHSTLAGA